METLTKELAPLKEQTSKAVQAANDLVIKTAEDMSAATDLLGKIKKVGKVISDKKNAITKPLNEALRNARAFFAPVELEFTQAEKIVKEKMVDYQTVENEKAAKKTEVIEKKVEEGKMTFDKAAEKIEAITPQKQVSTENAKAQFRTIKEVVIEDETKLPREYLMADVQKIKKVALAGVEIPGVKVVEKQIVAGGTRF